MEEAEKKGMKVVLKRLAIIKILGAVLSKLFIVTTIIDIVLFVDFILKLLIKKHRLNVFYGNLKKYNLIEDKDEIKGYISDKLNEEYLEINVENEKSIEVKKSDAILILLISDSVKRLNNSDKFITEKYSDTGIEYILKKNEFGIYEIKKTKQLVNRYNLKENDNEFREYGVFIENAITLISKMQRQYIINRDEELFEYIYLDNQMTISIEKKLTNIKSEYKIRNEYDLLPFLQKKTLDVSGKVSEEYTANLIKSKLWEVIKFDLTDIRVRGYVQTKDFKFKNKDINFIEGTNLGEPVLYDFKFKMIDKFNEEMIKDKCLNHLAAKILKETKKINNINLEEVVIKKLDINKIKGFLKKQIKMEYLGLNKVKLIFRTEGFEYRYNSLDEIIGGGVSFYAKIPTPFNNTTLKGTKGASEVKEGSFIFDSFSSINSIEGCENQGTGAIEIDEYVIGKNLELKENKVDEIIFIEKGNENSSIIYKYNKLNSVEILYGKQQQEFNNLVINNFEPEDYGIEIYNYHKLYGTLNEKIEDSGECVFVENPEEIIISEKKGGDKIILLLNSLKIPLTLGQNIEFIEKVEKSYQNGKTKDTIYRYKQNSIGNYNLSKELYFDFYLEDNILDIFYGDLINGNSKYGNRIKIENFSNGDFGINLAIDYAILYGTKYLNMGKDIDISYKFRNGLPAENYSNSNGTGHIWIDNFCLSDDKILNIMSSDEVEETLKPLIERIETDPLAINIHAMKGRNNFYLFCKEENELLIFYSTKELNQVDIMIKNDKYEIEGFYKLVIKDFKNGDYNIKLPIDFIELSGLKYDEVYIIKEGDTLSKIALEKWKDANLWQNIENGKGQPFTTKEAKRIKVGQRVYMVANVIERGINE